MMTVNNSCRICLNTDLKLFLDLTDQPPANRFLKSTELSESEPSYPLQVYWCPECNLAQLKHVVDKTELFENYIYFSSGMPKLSDHFQRYAADTISRFLKPKDLVVEIASNDGILLKFYQDNGCRVLGVDPAKNIATVAVERGVPTRCDFFSEAVATSIAAEQGQAQLILANNVVAHINDHHDLAKGLKTLLAPKGAFVLEAPYLVDMFTNLTYDTIYHEHLSYLAVRPLIQLFSQFGLEIFDVELYPVQGQSIRVFAGHAGAYPVSNNVEKFIRKELDWHFDKFSAYQKLSERIANSKMQLVDILKGIKSENKTIAAYGAPAKGNTLLNYCQIGTDILDYALEDLPSKQGLYTPGQHIPVLNRKSAETNQPDYWLLLAWNYLKPIMTKEENFVKNGGKFIIPVGDKIKII